MGKKARYWKKYCEFEFIQRKKENNNVLRLNKIHVK